MTIRVGFVEGHNEEICLAKEENISEFIYLIGEAGLECGQISNLLSKREMSKYDVLVLGRPKIDLTVEEKDALLQFVSGGKSLLVLGDRDGLPLKHVEELTVNLGFRFKENWIYVDKPTLSPVIQSFESHDITAGVDKIVYPFGCTIEISNPKSCTGLFLATKKHMNTTLIKRPSSRTPPKRIEGRRPVICCSTYGKGLVVAIGSYLVLTKQALSMTKDIELAIQTRKMILNVFYWLSRQPVITEPIYPKIFDIIYVGGSAVLGLFASFFIEGLVGGLFLVISLLPLLWSIFDKLSSR